jgi:hypothetical protein
MFLGASFCMSKVKNLQKLFQIYILIAACSAKPIAMEFIGFSRVTIGMNALENPNHVYC